MTSEELAHIYSLRNCCITAPAGHGKTEMVADLVAGFSGKRVLILTHTHAGVDSIRKRLIKKKVPNSKYLLDTIAGFCLRWCAAYSNLSGLPSLSALAEEPKKEDYFAMVYQGAEKLFRYPWAGKVVKASFDAVIVDEYQDCILDQQNVFVQLNRFLPVWVFGDPLQGIYGWAGELVNWGTIPFQQISIPTLPWRWKDTCPDLGDYLNDLRATFLPLLQKQKVIFSIPEGKSYLQFFPLKTGEPLNSLVYQVAKKMAKDEQMLIISRFRYEQENVSRMMGDFAQNDEAEDSSLLNEYAKKFGDEKGCDLALSVFQFFGKVSTSVNTETKTFQDNLKKGETGFQKIQKNKELVDPVQNLVNEKTAANIESLLSSLKRLKPCKTFRLEAFSEMIRCLRYSRETAFSFEESMFRIRSDVGLQKRYDGFRCISSRTVLTKGLEFEYVIIDMRDPLEGKDFYVAMTRATKKIFVVGETSCFSFS